MAYFTEQQLPRYREDDMPGTVKKLYNFCRELQEMLQFVLSNLDGDNIEGYEEIFNRLTDADGNISILKQTAEEILAQVRNNEGQLGELSVRADGIDARVQDNEKGIALLRITADGISSQVADNQKNLSSVSQTAEKLSTRILDAEGNISSLEQTAKGLSSRVSSAEGSISTVTQTAKGLTSTVSDLSGKYSSLKQTVDGFDFDGLVSFTDLERSGRTDINGDNITSGTIDVDYLGFNNRYGGIRPATGYSTDVEGTTRGVQVFASSGSGAPEGYYMIVTTGGCRMTAITNNFWVGSKQTHSDAAISEGSDARIKNTVTYDVGERYEKFFRALKPARYHRNDSTSGRFHTGFIAQQMRDALMEAGLTTQDLAALVQQDYDAEAGDGGGGAFAVRYTELVALNTAMVQGLLERVDTLEEQVRQLKGV